MKSFILLTASIFLFSAGNCPSQTSGTKTISRNGQVASGNNQPAALSSILQSLTKEMSNAQINYDTATLDRIYASDFVEISPVGEFDSREKTISFYQPEANPNRDKIKRFIEMDELDVRDYNNFALIVTRVTFRCETEGQAPRPPISFRTTFVCRKEKGEWKIASVQYTAMRPPPTPANSN
jgi:ketosteroid isomerase-like protein